MRKLFRAMLVAILVGMACGVRVPIRAQGGTVRRVNMPHLSEPVTWAESAIFWLGKNEYPDFPGRNYTDVRLAYTDQALEVRFTVIDYYLWQASSPGLNGDLTVYDAAAVYVDVGLDRSAAPQTDDYWFLIGAHHWPNEDAPQYRRQARGNGAGWDVTWDGVWSDYEAMQWSDDGPNDNSGNTDYGWTAIFTIPWSTLGLSGPPDKGTVWGLGVQVYDRDASDISGLLDPERWPETFDASSPATWGELHFGYADYEPPARASEGTTTIRASSSTDNTVEDAWMGGGGTCSGGHEGGSELNHGDSTNLFVGTETAPTHFPCFNKSYLRFSLDALPPDKSILSATLTLHVWSDAGAAGQAPASWAHVFTVSDPWEEMTIHWNNAPLAKENVAASWIYPVVDSPGWPGISYHWDVTQAVAEAYGDSQPLSLALYSSDTAQHSSKYLVSSETGDWNIEGRPALTVIWGTAVAVDKRAQIQPLAGERTLGIGGTITYTIEVIGAGQTLTVTDVLPAQVSHPSSYVSNSGSPVSYDPGQRTLTWIGTPAAGETVTITFPVTVVQEGTYRLVNTAHLSAEDGTALTDDCPVFVDPWQAFLPNVLRGW